MTVAQVRKALVAVLGVAAQVPATALPEAWRPWAAVVVALATAVGVYAVPNAAAGYNGEHEA